MTIQEIKLNFPNEWVLLGNPLFSDNTILEAEVLLHGTDKSELAIKGQFLREQYQMLKFFYTGNFKPARRIGVLKRI